MSDIFLRFLTLVEEREFRLLTWGYVDGGFNRSELELLGDDFALTADASGTLTGADLVTQLLDRALMFEVDEGAATRYRTRAGETMRLLARLRQLFPKHHGESWARARTLVADYRILARPRSYPRRNLSVPVALEELRAAGLIRGDRAAALEATLKSRHEGEFLLSRFQVDATREVLRGLDSRRSGGTIVGAGTGSGKTLAFYLPALSHVIAGRGGGTRVLAIYPRIELLRDQFAEAYREARRLDGIGGLGRPIRIGALYGSTPHHPRGALHVWKSRGEDTVCPYMLCPACAEGSLIWSRADIEAATERLVCSTCSTEVGPDHVSFTRNHMKSEPPDVLFTTTEMLNRSLMDDGMRHLVGAGPRAMPIDLVLLDEVHTYEGTTGAHVAGVLRRWRHARRRPVHFVGLSATLREAGDYFASLTGLSVHEITSIEPKVDDLDQEGQEYMVAVRADPHSGASVLSTTIQATMLMQRSLDPMSGGPSLGAYGQRVFTFTDDLDVTNRLFFDLLDAEGLNSWGQPEKPSLAALRAPVGPDVPARRGGGQTWDALERIGHRLDEDTHVRIGRTTSQDAEVDRSASAIVATASLEVGFNDARVGAVIQHKSPHDVAAFLQRKGRAGRTRSMRPWTLAVLSDFGRDRATYQSYEQLFDPELPPRTLAVSNPSVIRMQAVFATLDWLAASIDGGAQIWQLLQRPPTGSGTWADRDRERQTAIADLLERVLTEEKTGEQLSSHVQAALGCSATTVQEIMWEPPRPLMTTVIPTALRRLRTGWRDLKRGAGQDYVGDGPLPEFVVSRLFGDLSLPEVTVVTPAQTKKEEARREPMRAVQAMSAYAPGRVSHRLTIAHRYARHWTAPPPFDDEGRGSMDFREFASEFEELGSFGQGEQKVRVVRPLTIEVQTPPADILSSSHGRLSWKAEIQPTADEGQLLRPPSASPLAGLVSKVEFHTHGGLAHVELRRWATTADVETHTLANTTRGTVEFVDTDAGGGPVGVGLATDVDALSVDVTVPRNVITAGTISDVHRRSLRVDYWRHLLAQSPVLQRLLGSFDVEHLADAAMLALIEQAVAHQGTLEHAFTALQDSDQLVEAIATTLQRRGVDANEDKSHRVGNIVTALEKPAVLDALEQALPALWRDPDVDADAWASRRLAVTVGAAFHTALQDLCPEYDADDLIVDVEPASVEQTHRVWLTEQTIGGGGILQAALTRVGDRPRRLFDLVAASSEPALGEVVDAELTRVTREAADDTPTADAIEKVRGASSHAKRTEAFDELLRTLQAAGVFVSHPVVSALSVRMLRPGATAQIDRTLADLLGRWDEMQDQLDIDIDLRTFAEIHSRTDAFDQSSGLAAPFTDPTGWRAGQITGLLWQRGSSVRRQALHAPNRFASLPDPDPLLMRACLPTRAQSAPIERLDDLLASDGPLARDGDAEIQAGPDQATALRRALLRAAAFPIEAGPLLHYPRVDGISRTPQGFRARLVLDLVGE